MIFNKHINFSRNIKTLWKNMYKNLGMFEQVSRKFSENFFVGKYFLKTKFRCYQPINAMLQMEVPTNLQKDTFAKKARTILDTYSLPSYRPVLAQPPIHTPPWSSTKIIWIFVSLWHTILVHRMTGTAWSKKAELVGCVVTISQQIIIQQRALQTSFSIFSAELQGILLATQHITQNSLQWGVIYTDSLSAIKALPSIRQPHQSIVSVIRETKLSQQLTLKY